jgi:hydrogenase maturation protease
MTDENHPCVTVIGVGNVDRADDGVGVAVARAVAQRVGPEVHVIEERGEVSRLMDAWDCVDVAILIDAVVSSHKPGTVHVFEAHEKPIEADVFCCSTHAMGLLEAMELARALGQFPGQMIVCGIEGKQFEPGAAMSPEVQAAIPGLVDQICERISRLRSCAAAGGIPHA